MKEQKDKYPGYPHYPAREDITNPDNNEGKLPLREEAGAGANTTAPRASDNDADVTADDLRTLDAAESNMDTIDSESLQRSLLDATDDEGDPLNEATPGDISGADLDVPGSEDDDSDEALGEEDEENNYYSLGGDNHENQEENKE